MSSPKDSKKNLPATDDSSNSQSQKATEAKKGSPPRSDQPDTTLKSEGDPKNAAQPLAPPPKPSQQNSEGDYFGSSHNSNNNSHFSLEPNPFEQSFGNPSTETPGKFGGLPSVASLTSPAPLGQNGTPGWGGSLRSGPLSPAMLTGPTGSNAGYFDEGFRNSFPTPNESSLRSGLTPGGGGSMFPAPSPNSQAIFNSMQSGGATPGTLDFHRTAMNAAARSKVEPGPNQQSQSQSTQGINKQDYQPAQQQQQQQSQQQQGQQHSADPFSNHPESDAVNSLYMLAQTGSRNANNQFAVPNQPQVAQMRGPHNMDTSPTTRDNKQSISSSANASEGGDYNSDASVDQKPSTRSNGKKASGGKGGKGANGKKKAEETPSKQANKKTKGNSGNALPMDDNDDDDGFSDTDMKDENNPNRRMTDDEKRRNFLERNRIAALKCRQRKKQWLANLQTKVEIFTSENEALTNTCTQLREEIVSLKTLLLAHKDCPVSHQQGIGGNGMAQLIGDMNPHANPYGLMPQGGNQMMGMQGQGMQRR